MELDIDQIMAAYDRKIAALTRQLVFAEAQLATLQARAEAQPLQPAAADGGSVEAV